MSLSLQATLRPIRSLCVSRTFVTQARSFVTTPHVTYTKAGRQPQFAPPTRDDDRHNSNNYRSRDNDGYQQRRTDTKSMMSKGGSRSAPRDPFAASKARARASAVPKVRPKMQPESLPRMLIGRVDEWVSSKRVEERLLSFGFQADEIEDALAAWAYKIKEELKTWDTGDESLIPKMTKLGWDAQALILAFEAGDYGSVLETAFLRHFVTYSTEHGPDRLRLHLRSLLRATDLSTIAQEHQNARNISRSFHLHMGPTNSGKTYNALKALSRAGTGVYAGPLRLLAHEVWERLNLGTVGELDGKGRACNLLTGEERRIVDTEAGLVACTVEMLPLAGVGGESWDTVVIDEIQMMGDSQRGGAWTNAIMGVNAKEIHLCGDETTAALLQSMIDSFKGDTLTIHRYDRLTPLSVSDKSLNSDWNKVQPGDCVVTFSRSNVFSVKKAIEGTLGKRCAVVYGALPPETRAEQAREFNEEAGRAEILVASDAVGMGLNLKIGRIIFESLTKYDGKKDVPLSLSQVKQIAGRAGRFGQQRQDATTDEVATAGGSVTTLHSADLPLLRAMLPLALPPITRATLEVPHLALVQLAPLLPATTTFVDLLDTYTSLAKLPDNTVLTDITKLYPLADVVEPFRTTLTLGEMDTLSHAPVNVRDPKVHTIFSNMVRAYAEGYLVEIEDVLASSTLLRTLTTVEETLAALPPLPPNLGVYRQYLSPAITISAIPLLESLHKALVLYIWLSFRLELAFPDRELASEYKKRTEKVLEVCLERMPGLRSKKRTERTKEMDHEHALYRRKYVDKHGLVKPSIEWVGHQTADPARRGERWRNLAQVLEDKPRQH